jgi:cation diffusion facilitator family transporter
LATAAKIRAAQLSVCSNSLLVLLKLGVGLWIGSVAVLSEAIHSGTDLLAALIAFFAVRASDAPPDAKHPYGHGKMESVSGIAEALLILGAGAYIIYKAVQALIHARESRLVGWGVAVMALSAIVNFFVARHLFRVARATESVALEADAHHLGIDIWTSLGVVAGLALVWITGRHLFDPLVALSVAFFILRTGWHILRRAFSPLLDEQLPEEEVRAVEAIMANHADILGWHKLRTRKSGSQRHIDVHIQVDDDMSLKDAHRLTEDLEDAMRAALPNLSVMIHTEPYEEEKRHHEEHPH